MLCVVVSLSCCGPNRNTECTVRQRPSTVDQIETQQDAAISGEAEAAVSSLRRAQGGHRTRCASLRVRFVLGNCQSGQPGHYRRAKISRISRAFRGGCGCWVTVSQRSQRSQPGTLAQHTAHKTGVRSSQSRLGPVCLFPSCGPMLLPNE